MTRKRFALGSIYIERQRHVCDVASYIALVNCLQISSHSKMTCNPNWTGTSALLQHRCRHSAQKGLFSEIISAGFSESWQKWKVTLLLGYRVVAKRFSYNNLSGYLFCRTSRIRSQNRSNNSKSIFRVCY